MNASIGFGCISQPVGRERRKRRRLISPLRHKVVRLGGRGGRGGRREAGAINFPFVLAPKCHPRRLLSSSDGGGGDFFIGVVSVSSPPPPPNFSSPVPSFFSFSLCVLPAIKMLRVPYGGEERERFRSFISPKNRRDILFPSSFFRDICINFFPLQTTTSTPASTTTRTTASTAASRTTTTTTSRPPPPTTPQSPASPSRRPSQRSGRWRTPPSARRRRPQTTGEEREGPRCRRRSSTSSTNI